MNMQRWIKRHRVTVTDQSGFVYGPFIRVEKLQELLKTHDVVRKKSPAEQPHSPPRKR